MVIIAISTLDTARHPSLADKMNNWHSRKLQCPGSHQRESCVQAHPQQARGSSEKHDRSLVSNLR